MPEGGCEAVGRAPREKKGKQIYDVNRLTKRSMFSVRHSFKILNIFARTRKKYNSLVESTT